MQRGAGLRERADGEPADAGRQRVARQAMVLAFDKLFVLAGVCCSWWCCRCFSSSRSPEPRRRPREAPHIDVEI